MSVISPVRYRYYTADLLSNQIISEIPFKSVNYERVIRKAGAFSGDIPFIKATKGLDLYESTMPGRTALYVMRNDICVWGGIIWGRSYDAISKTLKIDASEFTSYLYHRHVWKTLIYGSEFYGVASYSVSNNVATVITELPHRYNVGSNVTVGFTNPAIDGQHQVIGVQSSTSFSFVTSSQDIAFRTSTSGAVRSLIDTYDFTRDLLNRTFSDFSGLDFANEEIEPQKTYDISVISKQRSNGVVTLRTQDEHTAIPGQEINVVMVGSGLDGFHQISAVPDSKTIKFNLVGDNVPLTPLSGIRTLNVVKKGLETTLGNPDAAVATIFTELPHGAAVGQIVYLDGIDSFFSGTLDKIFNGRYVITSVPTTTSFTYTTVGILNIDSNSSDGSVSGGLLFLGSKFIYGEYGGFIANSDIDMSFSTLDQSGYSQDRQEIRGFEMKSIGEILEQYSDNIDGFEYRIDCEYDFNTASFRRIFIFMELSIPNVTRSSDGAEVAELLGANNYTFEYPGNIQTFSITESAENAATRMFVVGNIGDLAGNISQPYAAASDRSLLNNVNGPSWPILDQVEVLSDVSDEETLFNFASDYLYESIPPIGDFTLTVNGSLDPLVGSYYPGDWCSIIIDDEFVRQRLASDQEPRSDILIRKINSYKITVPDSPTFPEIVTLNLITDWKVDKRG